MFKHSTISLSAFQQDYWRTRPAELGQVDIEAIASLGVPDFFELAAEKEVESRLISVKNGAYELEHGPFSELTLASEQMLMVQNVESFSYQVSHWLTQNFGFLPRWRIEDVMATICHQGASCGPHFDQYDVFLIQLSGTKHWALDAGEHDASHLDTDSDIRLLKHFEPVQSLTQNPGDVLYIPPGVGHHGIAESDDCITLSVGFRNPLVSEMVSHLADLVLQQDDSGTSLSDQFGGDMIDVEEVTRLGETLSDTLNQNQLMSIWYGGYMTLPRDSGLVQQPFEEITDLTQWRAEHPMVYLDLPTRIAYQSGFLFVNGEALPITPQNRGRDWLLELQQQREVATEAIPLEDDDLLLALLSAGAVLLYPDD